MGKNLTLREFVSNKGCAILFTSIFKVMVR